MDLTKLSEIKEVREATKDEMDLVQQLSDAEKELKEIETKQRVIRHIHSNINAKLIQKIGFGVITHEGKKYMYIGKELEIF